MYKIYSALIGVMVLCLSSIGFSFNENPMIVLQFSPTIDFQYSKDNFNVSVVKHTNSTPYYLGRGTPKLVYVKPGNHLIEMMGENFYTTNIDGIGVVLKIDGKDIAIEKDNSQIIGTFSDQLAFSADLVIYKKLNSGIYHVFQQKVAEVQVGEDSNEFIPIKLLPIEIKIKQKTCELMNKNQTISLKTISPLDIAKKNSEFYGGSFQIGLNCDEGVNAHITFWDQTTYDNHTSLLSLASNSTAKGVKLRIYKNNDVVYFGKERLFAYKQQQPTQNFVVNYVNVDGKVSPGMVNAIAAITFTYR